MKKIDFLNGWLDGPRACENKFNIASNLSKLSKNVSNLGMSGNSFLINYATLIGLKGKKLRELSYFYRGNDLEGLSFEIGNNILQKYLSDYNYSQIWSKSSLK